MADDAAVQPAAAAAAVAVAAEAEEEGAKKVCLVTGASSGIGRATAILFAEAGYRVIAASRDTEALNEVCQIIGDAGGDAEAVALDLTSNESCRNAADFAVRTFGRIDCLVNSGGVIRGGAADAIDVDNFDFNMSVNTRGAFCIMAACIPHLKKTKGNVVHVSCRLDSSKRTCVSHRRGKLAHFPHLLRGVCVCVCQVSSVTGQQSFGGCLSYCCSKAAVDMMVKCAAVDLAPHGVRVNSVNPGVIVTNLHRRGGMDPESYAKFLEHSKVTHPIGFVVQCECMYVCVYVCVYVQYVCMLHLHWLV